MTSNVFDRPATLSKYGLTVNAYVEVRAGGTVDCVNESLP